MGHQVGDHGGDALAFGDAQHAGGLAGQGGGVQHAGRDGVLDVMVEEGDVVGDAHGAALHGAGPGPLCVGDDAVAHLPRKVQPPPLLFQHVHHPQALPVMGKAAGAQLIQRALARMAEGGVPQVVPQGDGLGQVLVQAQGAGDSAGDLRHLQRVGQPGAVVVALRREKDLGLLLEPAERLAVDDAVPVPLVAGPHGVGRLRPAAAPACLAQGRIAAEGQALERLGLFPYGVHAFSFPGDAAAVTSLQCGGSAAAVRRRALLFGSLGGLFGASIL